MEQTGTRSLTTYMCGKGYIFVVLPLSSILLQLGHIVTQSSTLISVPQTSKCVFASDVHRARAANAYIKVVGSTEEKHDCRTFAAAASERECRILFILDFDKRIKNHRTAVIEINFIRLHMRLVAALFRIPSVDLYTTSCILAFLTCE